MEVSVRLAHSEPDYSRVLIVSDKMVTSIVSVLLAIIGVAIVALIVSKSGNSSGVLSATGKGFGGALACALSPVTGGSCSSSSLTPSVTSSISFGDLQ